MNVQDSRITRTTRGSLSEILKSDLPTLVVTESTGFWLLPLRCRGYRVLGRFPEDAHEVSTELLRVVGGGVGRLLQASDVIGVCWEFCDPDAESERQGPTSVSSLSD